MQNIPYDIPAFFSTIEKKLENYVDPIPFSEGYITKCSDLEILLVRIIEAEFSSYQRRSLGDLYLIVKNHYIKDVTLLQVQTALSKLLSNKTLFYWFCRNIRKRVYMTRERYGAGSYYIMTGSERDSDEFGINIDIINHLMK